MKYLILLTLIACEPRKELCQSLYEERDVLVTRCSSNAAGGALIDMALGGDGVIGGIIGSGSQHCTTLTEKQKVRVGEKCEPNPEWYKWKERNSK